MTRIDQIIADAIAGSPETHVAILAREVVRLREAQAVVVPEIMLSDISDECSAMLCDDREAFRRGALWAQKFITSKARAIPADRVLGDGMKFFWIDPVNFAFGFEEVEDHARGRAEKAIEMENSEARLSEGIFEKESLGICYGVVLAKAAVSKEPKYNDFSSLILEPIRANQGGADHV